MGLGVVNISIFYMSYSLHSLKGVHIRGIKGDTRKLDYGSCAFIKFVPLTLFSVGTLHPKFRRP